MLTTMYKMEHKQPLIIYGHLNKSEIRNYKRLGYRVEMQEEKTVERNKNGIERG